MRTRTWGVSIIIMVALFLLMTSTQSFAKDTRWVWEAEDGRIATGKAFVVKPYVKDPTGPVSGKKVMAIEKLPQGQKVAKDEVTYQVTIPENGVYYLWARVLWSTGCGNSFLFKSQGITGEWVLGGDGTYDAMHWICLSDGNRPRALQLKKGKITFTLGAKESGTRADQFLLTTDRRYVPQGIYKATANLLVAPKK